ncbi:MAG: hypothetical protein IT350_03495 [Deltaproteobacteria bacterium]|nr:hypothetical protein [Deltaproteobacteria bacterium]
MNYDRIDGSTFDEFVARSRTGVSFFFAVMGAYFIGQIYFLAWSPASAVLSRSWSFASLCVNAFCLAVCGHYLFSLRRARPRPADDGDDHDPAFRSGRPFSRRAIYLHMVVVASVIMTTMLVHTWMLGSMNSMHFMNALLVFVVVSWILRYRDALILFVAGNAALALILTFEARGVVPYAPIFRTEIDLGNVFLDPRIVAMVLGIYGAYTALALVAIHRFQRVHRQNHDQLTAAHEALRVEVEARIREVEARTRAEAEKEIIIANLNAALADVKQLRGLLPICASCKKVRNDEGYWQGIDLYLRDHADVELTHGICPDCMASLYPDV